jgi:hypothetical protein
MNHGYNVRSSTCALLPFSMVRARVFKHLEAAGNSFDPLGKGNVWFPTLPKDLVNVRIEAQSPQVLQGEGVARSSFPKSEGRLGFGNPSFVAHAFRELIEQAGNAVKLVEERAPLGLIVAHGLGSVAPDSTSTRVGSMQARAQLVPRSNADTLLIALGEGGNRTGEIPWVGSRNDASAWILIRNIRVA